MTKLKGGLIGLCIMCLFLLVGCEKSPQIDPEEALATAQVLMTQDEEIMEIIFNGNVPVDETQSQDVDGTTYYQVNDGRFQDLNSLESYVAGFYAESNRNFIASLLVLPDPAAPLYTDIDGKLYRLANPRTIAWAAVKIDTISVTDITETSAAIHYSYMDGDGYFLTAYTTMSVDDEGEWLLDQSHYQVIGGFDDNQTNGNDEDLLLYLLDIDTGEFNTVPLELDENETLTPEIAITALIEEIGMSININAVTVDGDEARVDFVGDGAPIMGVGSAQETMILDSFSKTLVELFPSVKKVYFSVGDGDYSSSHYEFKVDEPYYEVE